MLLTTWLTHALAVVGATIILTQGRVVRPLRRLADRAGTGVGKFVRCPLCVGFWVGVVGAGVDWRTSGWVRFEAGCAGSALAWIAFVALAAAGAFEHMEDD